MTKALQFNPDDQEVRLIVTSNARIGDNNSIVPLGYYGNGFMNPAVTTTAKRLLENYEYALELVKEAKAKVNNEYLQSVVDLMVIKDYPNYSVTRSTCLMSDLRRIGFRNVDFGWGKALYGGPPMAGFGMFTHQLIFLIDGINEEGEEGIVVPIMLPSKSMKMFMEELDNVLGINNNA